MVTRQEKIGKKFDFMKLGNEHDRQSYRDFGLRIHDTSSETVTFIVYDKDTSIL